MAAVSYGNHFIHVSTFAGKMLEEIGQTRELGTTYEANDITATFQHLTVLAQQLHVLCIVAAELFNIMSLQRVPVVSI